MVPNAEPLWRGLYRTSWRHKFGRKIFHANFCFHFFSLTFLCILLATRNRVQLSANENNARRCVAYKQNNSSIICESIKICSLVGENIRIFNVDWKVENGIAIEKLCYLLYLVNYLILFTCIHSSKIVNWESFTKQFDAINGLNSTSVNQL